MPYNNVVITGTSRGIGFHLAQRFLKEGFNVIGISRSPSPIYDSRFQQIRADLSSLNEVKQLEKELASMDIHGLINNAGIHGPVGLLEKVPLDEWVNTFNINLFAPAILSRICLPSLRRRKGFIIFMSGGGSAFPRPHYSGYGVSKCGVIRLADTLAAEVSPEVLVYCVAPGPNRTALLDETRENGELVHESDIVGFDLPENLCLFLAHNKDPRYSGKFIHVKDRYANWEEKELSQEAYTLRRIDIRTLSQIDL